MSVGDIDRIFAAMINFKEFHLSNGLHVIVHEDATSPTVCMNLLYKVGSRNESPNKTGFAHLFEHLMFGGSKHIKNFDTPLQLVGGDNNAFTSTDITNYYNVVPANNIETAFWLESDRMLSLSFDQEVLDVQKKVVIEEFKQRYLNQPYGDIWLKLRPLAYNVHPYQWPTIGKELSHIEEATMDDVKNFFGSYYGPNNAILVLAGGISLEKAQELSEKWFGPIDAVDLRQPGIEMEPKQNEARFLSLEREVPVDAIYKVYHMPGRKDESYHQADLLSDILGRGNSSYLHESLVKTNPIFSSLSAYVTGSVDPGLFVVSGRLGEGVSFEEAESGIAEVLGRVNSGDVYEEDLTRVKNQAESSMVFGEIELLNRAMGLAYAAFLGDAQKVNKEIEEIRGVKMEDLLAMGEDILKDSNCSTIHYQKK